MSALPRAAALAFREAGPPPGSAARTALLVHGWPESSHMWRHLLPALGQAGIRALAPDLPGFGDSPPRPPGTWERHVEALDSFHRALDLGPVDLITHDWGVPIGLRWACDRPGVARSLTISSGGFFADRRWHDLANVLRTPGAGEEFMEAFDRPAFDAALRAASSSFDADALAEYWKAFADPVRRSGSLELYRSGDFEKLEPYQGRLAELRVPALVLWGAEDRFASAAMAERFAAELPDARVVVFPDAGHFVWEERPEQSTREVLALLAGR